MPDNTRTDVNNLPKKDNRQSDTKQSDMDKKTQSDKSMPRQGNL